MTSAGAKVVLLASLSLMALQASGQTKRYASPSGSDSNPGTLASPYQTIGKAASVVNPGDTVIVMDGIYHEGLYLTRSGTSNAYVTFASQNKWGAVLDGNNNAIGTGVQFAANYIRFQGFEVRGYGALNGGGEAFSTYPGGQFIDIVGNYVHDIGRMCGTSDAHDGGSGIFIESPNNTIEQNMIADIGKYAPGENGCNATFNPTHDHGLYVNAGSSNTMIRNNVFYRAERGWSIQVYPDGLDSLSILNNTFIWSNPHDTGQIILDTSAPLTNLRIENNISYNPSANFIIFYTSNGIGTVANNIIFNGTVSDSSPSGIKFSGNLDNTAPLLVNPGSAVMDSSPLIPDAHLLSGSPAIGAGLDIPDVTNDYAGNPRPQGSPYDIGALQSTSPSSAKPLPPTDLKASVH